MSGSIQFDVTTFRALFAQFSSATTYPDNVLALYWASATAYISNRPQCGFGSLTLQQQTLALNQMTAHLAQLNTLAAAGQSGAVVTGATIDKVNVTLMPPPANNEWQWWLNQTPYGAMLLSLLQVAGAGGFYIGGFPTSNALRR